MTKQLALRDPSDEARPVSSYSEMGAYEALWLAPRTTFKSLAERFARHPGSLPSDFVSEEESLDCARFVTERFEQTNISGFGVRIYGTGEYPSQLRDAANPLEFIYYQGWWDLMFSPCVAVVGTRRPSEEGLSNTRSLVRELVKADFTVVSGLAAGIDRMAHKTAIDEDGRTIAVIGTPLSNTYPKENADLQRFISEHFLLISQVPVRRYEEERDYRRNRSFFPARNVTMSALTKATIIVEAGETSGTLVQARAAIRQNRKLFVLDSCFRNPRLTWPATLEAKGAIRVRNCDDVLEKLTQPVQ